jgi:uncharacterized protein YheU (UPF0270 family)
MRHTSLSTGPSEEAGSGVELDPEQLSPGALRGLIEEFVTREGTDYGAGLGGPAASGGDESEWSLEDKVVQVYRQLASGEARIVFDLESESASIVPARSARPIRRTPRRRAAQS